MPLPEGVTHWDGPLLEAWKPWAPETCARMLADCKLPWCVVGGWALDLSIGRETRFHEDLEIAITRDGIPHLKAHGALLYKAKGQRPKDEADFAIAAPLLSAAERAWLIEALGLAHPGHAWIAALKG